MKLVALPQCQLLKSRNQTWNPSITKKNNQPAVVFLEKTSPPCNWGEKKRFYFSRSTIPIKFGILFRGQYVDIIFPLKKKWLMFSRTIFSPTIQTFKTTTTVVRASSTLRLSSSSSAARCRAAYDNQVVLEGW